MLSENVQNFDDVKFDAASLIAKLYQEQNQSIMAKQILRKALQISQHNVYWHCRLLFQLAVSTDISPFTIELFDLKYLNNFFNEFSTAITC